MPRNIGLLRILQLIDRLQRERVTLADLAKDFNVTGRTIRRDLDLLQETGRYRVRKSDEGYYLSGHC